MITVRRAAERGVAHLDWLESRHTFSFADYYDRNHMGFGPLRVLNEDRVKPGQGFGKHGHRDMEIISYVLDGALEHKDSIGTGSVIRPGDVQVMSAGTGIQHSEFNHSSSEPVHFLQMWIIPDRERIPPRYEQKAFPDAEKRARLRIIGSADGRDGSVLIQQDVTMFTSLLNRGEHVKQPMQRGRMAWVQILRGSVTVNGIELGAGDGAAAKDELELSITAGSDRSELLLFDVPQPAPAETHRA